MKLMLEHNLDDGLQMIDGVVHLFSLFFFLFLILDLDTLGFCIDR